MTHGEAPGDAAGTGPGAGGGARGGPGDAARARRARRAVMASRRAARGALTRARAAASAQGAGESGLARVIELHLVNAAGDALIAISLAGTLFFAVPSGEARGKVALYLLLTMAPFALVAPVVGPFLDRFRHGRRWALGTTTALRAFLCWVMAGAVEGGDFSLYPAAFGCLVASRAYNVTRAAAVPRVLPRSVELVTANSRISLAGVAGTCLAGPVGVGLATVGPQWPLRLAFGVFVAATVLAVLLPARVDSAHGEQEVGALAPAGRASRRGRGVPATVVVGLRGNAGARGFSGFLTTYLAFTLRAEPVGGLSDTVAIGLAVVAATLGSTGGTTAGAALRARRPDGVITVVVALAAGTAVLAATAYGVLAVLLVAMVAGFAQQLARLCLDAIVQRDVADEVRTSAFARSETLLQLAWVVGGLVGLVMPLRPAVGFGVAALGLVASVALMIRGHQQVRKHRPPPATGRRASG